MKEGISFRLLCRGFRKFWFDNHFRNGIFSWGGLAIIIYLLSSLFVVSTSSFIMANNSIDSLRKSDTVFVDPLKIKSFENLNEIYSNSNKYILKTDFEFLLKTYRFRVLSTGLVFGALIWLILTNIVRRLNSKRKLDNGVITLLFKNQEYKNELLWVSMAVVFLLALFMLFNILVWNIPNDKKSYFHQIIDNPGGFFAFVTGAATLIGTYFAIRSIINMKNTITSYSQLLDRLWHLINEASENSTKEVNLLCYFVRPGYWQVPYDIIKDNFVKSLHSEKSKIHIICLSHYDHFKFILDIAKLKNFDKDKIYELDKNSEDDLELIRTQGFINESRLTIQRLDWKDMPSYYFFVSDLRAIVVSPIGLPSMNKSIENNKELDNYWNKYLEFAEKRAKAKTSKEINSIVKDMKDLIDYMLKLVDSKNNKVDGKIQTLGFETTDHDIIYMLKNQFEIYLQK